MHRTYSLLTLFVWGWCFINCFAERLEVFDLQAANSVVCCGEGTGSENIPSAPSDPCDICDFCDFGVPPGISHLSMQIPPSDIESDIDIFLLNSSLDSKIDLTRPPPDTYAQNQFLQPLCEELVRTGLPVRGPTIV